MDKLSLGIELGSSRIKAVLLEGVKTIASSNFEWENQFINGYWTYDLDYMWEALKIVTSDIFTDYFKKYGNKLRKIDYIGISAMMHGYLAFDKNGKVLVPFRTWRNTNTNEASEELSEIFQFNIPHRWSIAHLYQAILNNEDHVKNISYFTTLSGYVHWKLTGEKVLGIGDASGMFPIDPIDSKFDQKMIDRFNCLVKDKVDWKLEDILPNIRIAGQDSGKLTKVGANLLGIEDYLMTSPMLCPPEGDAGTGMVSTNSIYKNTGNVSAGTSIFLMLVLDKALKNYYREVDLVTTPDGKHTAMIHCNNFTSDINNWVNLFSELLDLLNVNKDKGEIFEHLFKKSLEADDTQGKIITCGYYAGEPIVKVNQGRPLIIQNPDSILNLANFMQAHIYSSLATLKIGTNILINNENVKIDYILGHGGFFKTEYVGQEYMANALNIPVSVLETAGEGGAWGIAILAKYMDYSDEYSLDEFLKKIVFKENKLSMYYPEKDKVEQYANYIERYKNMLEVEKVAVEKIHY